jgi:4-amino-4-deoxy-L-arabinose transferase-like glycosyltransferase
MNPAALYFASGESLYPGATLVLLAIAASPWLSARWHFQLRNIVAWIGLALVVMACPPFPWIIDLIFLMAFASWLIAWNTRVRHQILRRVTALVLASLMVVCSVSEWRHRRMPALSGPGADHLVVIGDSISSGISSRVSAWPALLQQSTNVPVINLARPAATAADGIAMAGELRPEDRVVLIELGGNDLITGLPVKGICRLA